MSNLSQRFKRLIPNKVKLEVIYFLYNILKIPYTRSELALEIVKWLPKGKPVIFFDIGANVGTFSKCMNGEYKIEKALLVEPVSALIPVLEKNFPDREKFQILNVAISDSIAETDFYINEDANFVSSLLRIDNKGEGFASQNFQDPVLTKIKTVTLDQIITDQKLKHIDLIKIDVQGAEHLVLLGGKETLKITKLVYTEFSFKPLYEKSSTFFDLYKILYDNNFILAEISPGYSSPNGELLQGDALFVNKALMN